MVVCLYFIVFGNNSLLLVIYGMLTLYSIFACLMFECAKVVGLDIPWPVIFSSEFTEYELSVLAFPVRPK